LLKGCTMFREYPEIMTVKHLAKALGIGKNTAYTLVHSGVIGSKRIGRKIIIPKSCVIDYVQSARYNADDRDSRQSNCQERSKT